MGGTDQKFAAAVGRDLQRRSEASVWSTDADFAGKRWSAENVEVPGQLCRSSRRPANDVFQAGEDSDHLLEKYFELLTDYRCLSCLNNDRQKLLGLDIVTQYHGRAAKLAQQAMS